MTVNNCVKERMISHRVYIEERSPPAELPMYL